MKKAILFSVVLGLASVAYAQEGDKPGAANERAGKSAAGKAERDPKSEKPLTATEMRVLNTLHGANQMEVAAGKLAQKNSDTAGIVRYGRMLAKDHTSADRKLSAFAAKRSFTLNDHTADMSALENRRGADFDSAFLTMMVKDHGEAIALVEGARETCEDRQVIAMLDQMLPVLKRHQAEAVKLQQQARAEQAR